MCFCVQYMDINQKVNQIDEDIIFVFNSLFSFSWKIGINKNISIACDATTFRILAFLM